MGEWLNQLYVIDDLKELDQKSHEILKAEVRRHLASHPEIIKVLKKELDPIYKQMAAKTKTRPIGKQPTKKTTRTRRASKRHR